MSSTSQATRGGTGGLQVKVADTSAEIKAAQSLRFRIFAEEMGAEVEGAELGLDQDHFDNYCHHLIVQDENQEIIACTRILTDSMARQAGRYYSESEFDLSAIRSLSGSFMEVGRTCVHPDYRNGGAIGVLWSGLASFMVSHKLDYLMGCASVPVTHDGPSIRGIYEHLKHKYLSPEDLRVSPHSPMPTELFSMPHDFDATRTVALPPLLKAYMRLGAYVCGEPCWDPAFNVADMFILLDRRRLNNRYTKHFITRREAAPSARPAVEPAYPVASNF